MNHIKYAGTEIEGKYESEPNVKNGHTESDGSLHFEGSGQECDGSCRDNCQCWNDCTCAQCINCTGCDENCEDCNCIECLCCCECRNKLDECDCISKKINSCQNVKCTDDDVCESCCDISIDLRKVEHHCNFCGNIEYNCQCDCSCECSCECNCEGDGYVGEIISEKMDIKKIPRFILDNYPDEINETCSNHHHFSFVNDKKDYYNLATEEFYNYFLDKIELWANRKKIHKNSEFWARFNGDNHFSARGFCVQEQLKMTEKLESSRYRILNFCYNVKNRGTLEIRLFPMFKKKYLNVSAFTETCQIINTYLDTHKSKTMRLKI